MALALAVASTSRSARKNGHVLHMHRVVERPDWVSCKAFPAFTPVASRSVSSYSSGTWSATDS